VLFPGERHHDQRLAAYDLLGQRLRGADSRAVAGAFGRLVAEINAYDGPRVLVSEEELGLARPRHVRRVLRSLPGSRVLVLLTVRDLARTIVSAWQQSVVMGGTRSWPEFIEAVQDPARGSTGLSFWARHDLVRVLDAWGSEVPPERIRLVTVPPSGASSGTLLDRFAAAAELPPGLWAGVSSPRNVSLGAAELEVLRRLNEKVVGPLDRRQHRHVVEHGIRAGLDGTGGRPLRLPHEHVGWVQERSAELVRELERRGHPVFGELDDLLPEDTPEGTSAPDEVTESELLAAAEAELCVLALAHGRLFTRYRRAFSREQGRLPSPAEVLSSSSRAAVFHLQKHALAAADNPLVNRAARAWLTHTR
jgi:hypothetical protein